MISIKVIGTPLYQWEVGRQVQVIPLLGNKVSAVHFSHLGDAEALVVEPREENGMIVADIPNVLLQSGSNLVVYSVNVSPDCVETLKECVVSVRSRAKPSDYVYTETEVLTWESLDGRIKALEESGGGSGDEPAVNAVLYTEQILAEEQKAQARKNIGALAGSFTKIKSLPPTITFIDDDTMRYNAVKRFHDIFANFGKGKNLYDMSANTDGYTLHSQNGSLIAEASYSASDYIAVDASTEYTFSRNGSLAPTWLLTIVCFYDREKAFISKLDPKTSTFTTPSDTAYLRFSTTTVRMEGSEGYIQLEKGATATAYEEYHNSSHNIKGCYGVITDYLDRDETLKNLLLEYEEEGFGMLFHAKWQDTYYMDNENRNIVDAERDYCKGIRRMREIGFIDYDYWVSPYGVIDDEIAGMCKRHGAKCLLSTYNNTFIETNGLDGNGNVVDRYAMPRCSLGYDDSQYPRFTLAHIKELVDKCVQSNGWIIITTHVQQWAETYGTTPDERLSELIQYALDSGCAVKTFSEAYAERNSVLMMNDVL